MKQMIRIEIRRAFSNINFFIALLIGCGISLWHFCTNILPITEVYLGDYPLSVYEKWIGGESVTVQPELYFVIIPILIAIPYSGSGFQDLKGGYIKNIFIRTNRKAYYGAKLIATFLVGGTIAILPLILNFGLACLKLPLIIPQASVGYYPIKAVSMMSQLFYTDPMIYIAIYFILIYIFFGLLASLGLLFGEFLDNFFITILSPFIIYFSIYTFTYLIGIEKFSPAGFLRPSQPIASEFWIVLVEIVVLVIAYISYYTLGARRENVI